MLSNALGRLIGVTPPLRPAIAIVRFGMGWSPQEAGKRSAPAAMRVGGSGFDRAPIRSDARGTPIPPELDFLVLHGVPSERLFAAVRSAPQGVTPLEVLLSEGAVSEETYYCALATRLGCAYYRGDPPFAANLDSVKSLRCGVAPLAGGASDVRAVIAPRGRSVSDLIERTLSGRLHGSSFAIASPQRLAALIRARQAEAVLHAALGHLPDALSARRGASAGQVAVAAALAVLAVVIDFTNPSFLQAALSAGLWAIFLAAIMLRSMAAVANEVVTRPQLLTDHELPVYTIVAPVYREAEVVGDLVQSLNKLDYPKSKLDIKIVAEQNDRRTLARLVELRLPACYEVIVAPPGAPQTKPRALNIALSSARGDLLTVYDVEDAPTSTQLRLAASRFAADRSIDCLQARLSIRNPSDSWLSNLFAVEYATLFDLINPGLCALKLPIALGGTSNHFRMSSLLDSGGWDEWNVAEDADLGVRLARFGYRVASLDSETSEEAPHEFANWFRQRVRWQKGWMRPVKQLLFSYLVNSLKAIWLKGLAPIATLSQQLECSRSLPPRERSGQLATRLLSENILTSAL